MNKNKSQNIQNVGANSLTTLKSVLFRNFTLE